MIANRTLRLSLLILLPSLACAPPPEESTGPAGDSAEVEEVSSSAVSLEINPNRRLFGTRKHCRLTVKVWACTSTTARSPNHVSCGVDSGWVAVGGGAWADYGTGDGAMLMASYPTNDDFHTWTALSKDHGVVNPHTLTVYVIGLQLHNTTSATMRANMVRVKAVSAPAHSPQVLATVPAGYLLVGGGARAETTGAGQFIVISSPTAVGIAPGKSWEARTKDHGWEEVVPVSAFAIGIKPTINGISLRNALDLDYSARVDTGVATVGERLTFGVPTGPGVQSQYWDGPGRMVFRVGPSTTDTTLQLWRASSKDHLWVTPGQILAPLLSLSDASYPPGSVCPY